MMNELIHETSPYLLQHAHNPVHWHAWSVATLQKAQAENKPILVSIGYSTCHWCHVMERESFENEETAALMNQYFINIKIDREERPDLDQIYMEACQLISGSGGWPLNCFLLPDQRPFFAGTYFPPQPAHGRPSWRQVLQNIHQAFTQRPEIVEEQAARLTKYIAESDNKLINKELITDEESHFFTKTDLDKIYQRLEARFDTENGGFGGAPKFPATMSLCFLLSYSKLTGNAAAKTHALFSINKMIWGGIYDHLGGGFSRYATDGAWKIPHFEKMLYDNALLLTLLADAYKWTKKQRYAEVMEETLNWLETEMKHPDGGYFSALDADSEGEEGRFYVWQKEEINTILGDDAALFCAAYHVTEEEKWEDKNIIFQKQDVEEFLEQNAPFNMLFAKQRLAAARKKLWSVRNLRIRPALDDKILLAWNALLCSAFCQAATAFSSSVYDNRATELLVFLTQQLRQPQGDGFYHSYKDGKASQEAFLDDYAFLIAAMLDVYETNFEVSWLAEAVKSTDYVIANFWDEADKLFFFTTVRQKDILLRRKDLYDAATPSGNSTMAKNLQRLALLVGKMDYRTYADEMLWATKDAILRHATSFSRWAAAASWQVYSPKEVVITGKEFRHTAAEINTFFTPNKIIMAADSSYKNELLAFEGKDLSKEAIYICENYACHKPFYSMQELKNNYEL